MINYHTLLVLNFHIIDIYYPNTNLDLITTLYFKNINSTFKHIINSKVFPLQLAT